MRERLRILLAILQAIGQEISEHEEYDLDTIKKTFVTVNSNIWIIAACISKDDYNFDSVDVIQETIEDALNELNYTPHDDLYNCLLDAHTIALDILADMTPPFSIAGGQS